MKIQFNQDYKIAFSNVEIGEFKVGEVVDLPEERALLIAQRGVAKLIEEIRAKASHPVEENKAIEPAKENKAKHKRKSK